MVVKPNVVQVKIPKTLDREERERRVSRAGWEEAVRQPHLQAGEADHLGPIPPIGFLQTWTSPS